VPASLGSVAKSTRKRPSSGQELEFEQLIEDAKNRKEQQEEELRVQARLEAKLAAKRAAQGAGGDARAEGVEQQTTRDSRGFFRFGRRSKSESSAKRRKECLIDEGVQVTAELAYAPLPESARADIVARKERERTKWYKKTTKTIVEALNATVPLGQVEADALVRKKQEATDRVFQQQLAKRSLLRRTELEEAKAITNRKEQEEEIERRSALREAVVAVAESAKQQQQQQPQFALQQRLPDAEEEQAVSSLSASHTSQEAAERVSADLIHALREKARAKQLERTEDIPVFETVTIKQMALPRMGCLGFSVQSVALAAAPEESAGTRKPAKQYLA
jgi:hypothetical protein